MKQEAFHDEGGPRLAIGQPPDELTEAAQFLDHDDPPRPGGLVDYYQTVTSINARVRRPFRLQWPAAWHIPTEADYHDYWILPPPDENRYKYQFKAASNPGSEVHCEADRTNGQLGVYATTSLDWQSYHSSAGVGARIAPSATLSYLELRADIDLVTQYRWEQPWDSNGYGQYRGTVYLACWMVDPVTGAWELVRPFAHRRLLDVTETAREQLPIRTESHAVDDLRARVLVQGGRRYAVSVSIELTLNRHGSAITDRTWADYKMWATMAGSVSRIDARTRNVLVP